MNLECKAVCEWHKTKYIAKISCQDDCKLNQKELGFGQMPNLEKAVMSFKAHLDSHCPVRIAARTAHTTKIA